MRKIIIIGLICFGSVLGYWLARKNQKLFELPIPQEQLQNGKSEGLVSKKSLNIGMDMWQVKEHLGPPLKRVVISEKPGLKKETWAYENQHLLFENGVLKSVEGK